MSQRVPVTLSLRDRIAALGLEGRQTAGTNSSTNQTTNSSSTPSNSVYGTSSSAAGVRDKAARFESIGGVPVPRGSFGLGAPPAFPGGKQSRELYGNRIGTGNYSPGSTSNPGSPPRRPGYDDEGNYIGIRNISNTSGLSENELDIPEGLSRDMGARIALEIIPPSPSAAVHQSDLVRRRRQSYEFKAVEQVVPPRRETSATHHAEPKVNDTPEPLEAIVSVQNAEVTQDGDTQVVSIKPPFAPSIVESLASIPESPLSADLLAKIPEPVVKSTQAELPAQPNPDPIIRTPSPIPSPPLPSTVTTNPKRNSKLSTTTSPPYSPRRARSQIPSRASSISSGVFTSPPDEGEVVGGGIYYSPTLEAVNASLEQHIEDVYNLDDFLDEADYIMTTTTAPVTPLSSLTTPHLDTATETEEEGTPDLGEQVLELSPPDETIVDEPPFLSEHPPGEFKALQEWNIEEDQSAKESFPDSAEHEVALVPEQLPDFYTVEDDLTPTQVTHTEPSSPLATEAILDQEPVVNNSPETKESGLVSPPPLTLKTSPAIDTVKSSLLAETASPARVMRELRQFGLDKHISNVPTASSHAKRSSVLSMFPVDVGPDTDSGPEFEASNGSEFSHTVTEIGSDSLNHQKSPSSEISPSTASVVSSSERSDLSLRLSNSSRPLSSISSMYSTNRSHMPPPPRPAPSIPIPALPTAKDLPAVPDEPLESPVPLPPPKVDFPNVEQPLPSHYTSTSEPHRALTPSPPPSFRTLFASGRLPPSSRGPGQHPSSSKTQLFHRAVSLINRPISSISIQRRSQSSFTGDAGHHTGHQVERTSEDDEGNGNLGVLRKEDARSRAVSTPGEIRARIWEQERTIPLPGMPVVVVDGDPSERRSRYIDFDNLGLPPTSFREASPASNSDSLSSASGPLHLFSPSFDHTIFDAFPEVPNSLPTGSMVARHSNTKPGLLVRGGHGELRNATRSRSGSKSKGQLMRMSNHSFTDLDLDHRTSEDGISRSKSDSGHGSRDSTIKDDPPSPVRRKGPSRKLIPGWYDDDDDGEGEMGWASVSVIRRRLA